MSETESERNAGEPSPRKTPPPAAFATQVVTLMGDEAPYHSDDLPLWSRLDKASGRQRRWLPWLAWCLIFGLLVVALFRIVYHDGAVLLTWFNAFTLYLYIPAYFVLAFAAWTKRWWLATASATVIAAHLSWVAPDFRPATPYSPPAAADGQSSPLKIYYANVRGGSNMKMDEVLAEARAADPDVIIFVEMQRHWWHEMIDRRPLPDYPYGTNLPNRNSGDIGVFSRLPVRRMEEVIVETRSSLVLDLMVNEQPLRLIALHSPRPTMHRTDNYYTFWDKLLPVIADRHGPEVVIGDFNATQHSRVYAKLLADGLRSAHDDRGRGFVTTWPNGARPAPPIRIDQAFLSPEVECVSIAEGTGPGSDHKPLILDLRVHSVGTGDTDPVGAIR